jgi:hypothetical protein
VARTFTQIHSEAPKAVRASDCGPGWYRRAVVSPVEPLACLFGPEKTVLFVGADRTADDPPTRVMINVGSGGVYGLNVDDLLDLYVPLDFTFTLTVAP